MPEINYFWDEIEDNVVREYDENNNTIAQYTTEPTRYGSVLSQERGGETRYFQFDGQGSTTELTNASGNVTDTRRYSAFGETMASSGATSTPIGFGGRWGYHSSGGAPVSIRRRQYALEASRWMSADPLGIAALRGTLLYRYASNCPPSHFDPSGLRDCYCKGCCPPTMKPFNFNLNAHINKVIAAAASVAGNALAFEISVWLDLAMDVKKGGLSATMVENWIERQIPGGQVIPGPKVLGLVKTADCFKLVCGGTTYCIGSDKIGHMFQQGHMLYEIESAPGLNRDYAFAFAMLTEGFIWHEIQITMLADPQYANADFTAIKKWIQTGAFSFYGFGLNIGIGKYAGKWGDSVGTGVPLVAQLSSADVWADVGGAQFWAELTSKKINGATAPFDICNYVNAKWEE